MSQFKVLPIQSITVTPSGTQDVNLTEVGGAAITEGQKTMANSIPVVIASDQSAVSVTASTLPLPTGASTSALQVSGNSQLVTIASNQTNGTQVTAVNSSVLPTGASTSANQTNASQKTQIVDGSGNVIASTSNALNVSVTGTSGTVSTNLTQVGGSAITEGQKIMANSLPVVIASDQSAITVAQSTAANFNATVVQSSGINLHVNVDNFPATQPVSGTVTVTQATGTNLHTVVDSGSITVTQATGTNLHAVIDSGTLTAVTAITNALPAGTNLLGKVGIDQTTVGTTNGVSIAQLGTGTINTGNGTSGTGTLRVAIASDNTSNTNPFLVADQKAATSTTSNVAASATSTSILALNATRKGAMIFNDSAATLYLKFGTTASTTSYTVQIAGNGYYEFPAYPGLYTGACDGIWSSATGNARVTELT